MIFALTFLIEGVFGISWATLEEDNGDIWWAP